MFQPLTVTFDGKAFHPEIQLDLDPNKRYQIQILAEDKSLVEDTEKEVEQFLDEAERAYIALRNDPTAWEEELAERKEWENTIIDGYKD